MGPDRRTSSCRSTPPTTPLRWHLAAVGLIVALGGALPAGVPAPAGLAAPTGGPAPAGESGPAGNAVSPDPAERLIDQLTGLDRYVNAHRLFHATDPDVRAGRKELPSDEDDATPKGEEGWKAAITLIRMGPEAVPALLKHLDDERPTGFGQVNPWMFDERPDYNCHPKLSPPFGVNLGGSLPRASNRSDDTEEAAEADEEEEAEEGAEDDPEPEREVLSHTFTVGDACFELLGEIVNRDFETFEGGCHWRQVTSPTRSPKLRLQLKMEWGGLSRETHRRSLIADLHHPDTPRRQQEAYVRLAFYYPECVEEVVLKELRRPFFDDELVETFCNETLFQETDISLRRRQLEAFIDQHGPAYADGIQAHLFAELWQLEANERRDPQDFLPWLSLRFLDESHERRVPEDTELCLLQASERRDLEAVWPPKPFAREALVELFHWPPDVRAESSPHRRYANDDERADFIAGLRCETGRKIGDAVRELLLSRPGPSPLTVAALHCLANRGYGDLIVAQFPRVNLPGAEAELHQARVLRAFATSRDPVVLAWLRRFLESTSNETLFFAALPIRAAVPEWDEMIVRRATEMLASLPEEADGGNRLLDLVVDRSPDEGRKVLLTFLKGRNQRRIQTVCRVSFPEAVAAEVLGPLLEDRRLMDPQSESDEIRVRDRVAMKLRGSLPGFDYGIDWLPEDRDEAIRNIQARYLLRASLNLD